jgi:protein-disulfide isomerase
MTVSLQHRAIRDLLAGAVLIAAPTLAVFVAKGTQKPWIPDCPAYRQKGNPDAKVTIIEFSDFQCPDCARAARTVKEILTQYDPDIRLLMKYHPWWFHRWAKKTAIAAECAGKQGKFWEFSDLLFEKQGEWAQSNDVGKLMDSYAQSVHLNIHAHKKCREDPAVTAVVESDLKEAKDHWVDATPTFFINGVRVTGSGQLRREGIREIKRILER